MIIFKKALVLKKLLINVVILVGLLTFMQIPTKAQVLYSAVSVSNSGTTGNSISNANTSRCLAVTADGTIYAVYHGSNGIQVTKSINRGASFSPSVLVTKSDFESEIAVSSTGTVYVTWVDGTSNAYLSKSTDNGTTFSSPIKVGTTISSVHMAVDGNYVYLIDRPGTTFYYSSDSGQTFAKVTFTETNVFSDVHVNRLTGEVIIQKDSPAIVYYVSQDHGKTFGSKKAPSASVNYSVGSISAGPLGSYLFIGGYSTMGTRINLADASAKTLSLGSSLTPQGRSLSVDGFGNVVTGFINNGNVYYAASTDLGNTFSSTNKVAAANMANAAINTTNGDIMFLYETGGKIYLSVFRDELTGYSLDVSTTNLNFGDQEANTSSAKKNITITNKSSKAVAVSKIDITGSDFSVSHNIGTSLNPGQSYTISVVFTPSKLNECSGMISIYTDAYKEPRIIQLSGNGLDKTIPNTTVQVSGPQGADGKYTGDVTLKFDASDIAGIARTEYSLNNGQGWSQTSGSAIFSDEGDYNILYRSIDKASNTEEPKQVRFTIKRLPKTVTLTYTSGEHGSISGSALQSVNFGESGTEVTAVPDTGYHFVSWSDGVTNPNRTDSNVSSDINLTATFAVNTYRLTYSGEHGSITGSASQAVNFGGSGTEVTAVPDTGYHFVSWSDGITSANRTDSNISEDMNLTAVFAQNTYSTKNTTADFNPLNPEDITFEASENSKLVNVKNGTSTLDAADYSTSGSAVTLNKSYLASIFEDSNIQSLILTFDFDAGDNYVLTINRLLPNSISCTNTVFNLSNPQNMTINISGNKLIAIKNGPAALNNIDYSVSGNTVTLNKSYLIYFFTKFNFPWQKLNLVFDFEKGDDLVFTATKMPITNFVSCDNPTFDLSNPQDITLTIQGSTLTSIKNGPAALKDIDYSISGNIVTIKKSYLKYFFTKFSDPWQKLNLEFDFEKGNDPLFSISKK